MGDVIVEKIPVVARMPGDSHFAGANNQLILLTRDHSFENEAGAGVVDLTVGRSKERPSTDDKARLTISSKSNPDDDLSFPGERATGRSSIVGRADCIRISGRVDIKLSTASAYIVISDNTITLDGQINLGEGATERVLRGDTFVRWAGGHTHMAPNGPTSVPVQPVPPDALSRRQVRVS